jgi:hypothetical protein
MKLEDNQIQVHPGAMPTTPILWPARQNTDNRIQQTKGSFVPRGTALPSTQPSIPIVAPRTTPPPVNNVRVVTKPAVNGQKTVIVQFSHPSGSPYFQGASVYLKRSQGGQPTQVASGAKSPLTFTVPVNQANHVVHVTSFGPAGETNILTSPSRPVKINA